MASLRRKVRSPFFFACYSGPDGRRIQRSTKQSNRKKAQTVADAWERASKLGAEKRLGEAQARRVLSDIYEAVNNEPLKSATTRSYLNSWVERREIDTSPRTYQAYSQVVRDFLNSLGPRADHDISQVSKADVAKYRDTVLKRTSIATANKSLKYLRVGIGAAYKDGLLHDNPAAKLDTLKRRQADSVQRRPFTVPELREILAHANGEWRGLVMFGLYTGQRLRDIARLTWANINLQTKELRFVTRKTGRRMHLPLAAPLFAYLNGLAATDDPGSPLFPKSYAIASGDSNDSRLSQQFHEILVAAGMATSRQKAATGRGRGLTRKINEISFHSLRHTATSLLKNAGVSEVVAMDIIGHDSKVISQHYTHVEQETKRGALSKLPDLTSS